MKREYFNKWYGLKPYYAALVVSRIPATVVFSLLFIIVTYPLTAQPLEFPRILMFTSICLTVALIAEAMGTVISSTLNVVVSIDLTKYDILNKYIFHRELKYFSSWPVKLS